MYREHIVNARLLVFEFQKQRALVILGSIKIEVFILRLKATSNQENQVAEKIDANGQSTGVFVYAAYINGVLYPVGFCAHGLCNHKSSEEAVEHWNLYNEGWG